MGYVAIVCVGIVLGSMGAGGSMLAIPVLVYVFTIGIETASAYSLFLVGITSLTGAALKRSEQLVSFRAVLFFGIPSVIGAFTCRKWIVVHVTDDRVLLGLFAILMIAASIRMLFKRSQQGSAVSSPGAARLIIPGFTVGLITALAGVGGGFLILPALTMLARLPFRIATGTSLLIISGNCLVAFCGDALNRTIEWNFLLPLTSLAVAGLLAGYWWHGKTQSRVSWHNVFAWLMMLVGVSILVTEIY